ncbi:MAG: hypothetical protein AAFV07_20125, partial [Bacteroidota bacterium]
MSYHQIEDIIEDAIRVVAGAAASIQERRSLIYNLYRFHDQHDTSYTRLRVHEILKANQYLYTLPVTQHPDYVDNQEYFTKAEKEGTSWIPADLAKKSPSVYLKQGQLFFEAGDDFWASVSAQLPAADREAPQSMSFSLVFQKILVFASAREDTLFLKRWYACLVNSILEYEIDEADGIPKSFGLWLQDSSLLGIRDFISQHQEIFQVEDEAYSEDELLDFPVLDEAMELAPDASEKAKVRFLLDFATPLSQIKKVYQKELAYRPDLDKYELIYHFFREKLDTSWEDGIQEISEKEGIITFFSRIPRRESGQTDFYACLIFD